MFMKKMVIILIVKVFIALWLALLGIFALTSCTASRSFESSGKARIVLVDTTVINHGGFINFKYK